MFNKKRNKQKGYTLNKHLISTNKPIFFSTHLLQSNGLYLPDEKGEERAQEEELHNPVNVYVCRAHRLPDLPQPVGETERGRLRAMQRGGGGGSKVVPPFPVTRETNALSKKNQPMTNTGNCVQTRIT